MGGVRNTGVGKLALRGVVSPGDNIGRHSDPPLKTLEEVLLRLELGELDGSGVSKHRAKSV